MKNWTSFGIQKFTFQRNVYWEERLECAIALFYAFFWSGVFLS